MSDHQTGTQIIQMAVGSIPVDPKRQRVLKTDWLAQLDREWDWRKCDPVVLFRRRHRNDELALFKGQHRVTVIRKQNGDAKVIDCSLADVWSDEEEDKLWNEHLFKKQDHSWTHGEKALNCVMRGDPKWLAIRDIVQRCGLSVQWSASHRKRDWTAISSTSALEAIYSSDESGPERLENVLRAVNQCWRGKPESTAPAVLQALDDFICRYKPTLSAPQWNRVLERLARIDPAQIGFRAKDAKASESYRERCAYALFELHNNACCAFNAGKGKLTWRLG